MSRVSRYLNEQQSRGATELPCTKANCHARVLGRDSDSPGTRLRCPTSWCGRMFTLKSRNGQQQWEEIS